MQSTASEPRSRAAPRGSDAADWPRGATARRLRLEWLLASTIGALASTLGLLAIRSLNALLMDTIIREAILSLLPATLLLTLALLIALAIAPQWWVLHRHIAGAGRWFLGTLLGCGLGLAVVALPAMLIVGNMASGPGPGRTVAFSMTAVLGLLALLFVAMPGVVQVLVLRVTDRRGTWWWVPANALGTLLLWGLEAAALGLHPEGPGSAIAVAGWMLAAAACGVPTALVLPRQLRRHR